MFERSPDHDLHRRCRDRDLITPELHASNDFYGHASLLKQYANRSGLSALKVAIEHGVILNDYVWNVDLESGMPLFLCANARRAALFDAKRRHGRAVAIGAIPHYLRRSPRRMPARKILLAFPSHSSHRVKASFDADLFAVRLADHGKRFDDVHVCVYWRDVLAGLDRTFRARGFEVVSAGHMFDPQFLPRLFTLLDSATAAMANEVSSAVLYAAFAGTPVWVEPQEITHVAPPEVLAVDVPDHREHATVLGLERLFAEPRETLSDEQAAVIAALMGTAHVRSPAQLAALFDEAEAEYRAHRSVRRTVRDAVRRLSFVRARVREELRRR